VSSSDPSSATTFPQFVRAIAQAYGEDTAITLKGKTLPDDAISYRALEQRSALLARGLVARGAGKGSRIGFIRGNGPEWMVAFAAIARIGAIAVPISTLLKANDLVRVLRQSDVSGVIVQRSLLGHDLAVRIAEALPEMAAQGRPELRLTAAPYLRWIVSEGADLPVGIREASWLTDAAPDVEPALLEALESEVHATDQVMEIYTSGSMAAPKGVRHAHGPLMFRTEFLRRMLDFGRSSQTAVPMPMFWVGGLMMFMMPALAGGGTANCSEGTLIDNRYAMGVVPPKEDLAKPLSGRVIWALGMTETLGPYSYGDTLRVDGYPLCAPLDHIAERYEVRVADANDQPVADGEIGEVQVRGYALTAGLHKLERRPYFCADGFLRTGDLARVDGNRYLFIGRDGDMIKTASSNVSPAEVEQELQSFDAVHYAYVVGIPDPERGQRVVAALIAREGHTPDLEAIDAEMRRRLSGYKVPRDYVLIEKDELPMLPSNKVAKRQLAALLAQRLQAG